MSYAYTYDGLKEFLVYLSEKGLLNSNTAGGIRTAVDKVLSALDENERQNLKGLDAAEAVQRFVNKNPKTLSPESIGVYRSRLQKALEMLDRFNTNPSGFRVSASVKQREAEGGARPNSAKKQQKSGQQQTPTNANSPQPGTTSEIVEKVGSHTLTFPLRADFLAQFVIPKNLTKREAERLSAYLALLAVEQNE
jgi:hypothetical protein